MILTKEKESMVNRLLNSNVFNRILTAFILIPIIMYTIIGGKFLFDLFLGFIFILSCYEVVMIINNKTISFSKKLIWIIPIITYIALSILSLEYIRLHSQGHFKILILFFCIWIFDAIAYFTGSWIGGPKLCPKISPKKTWAGLIGGIVVTFFFPKFILTITFNHIFIDDFGIITGFYFCLIGIIGQIGDLIESYFKRKFNIKNSGNILPGHGGIVDRFDSIYLASIFFCTLLHYH